MILSRSQVAAYAFASGFRGDALQIIVAIARAESGWDTSKTSPLNSDGSVDRGLVQINSRAHSEVPDSQCYNPQGAMAAAYRISKGGTDFTPWTMFKNGEYKQYLQETVSSVNGNPVVQEHIKWISYPITNGYSTTQIPGNGDSPHYAVDIATPYHTAIQALVSGVVKIADYQAWGGQVFIANDAGGPQWYVYHLDQISVSVGQHVNLGDIIGLSGGQNGYGSHPTLPQWSTGPHTHTGWFTKYLNTPIGSRPYGPDITPYITRLQNGDIVVGANPTAGPVGGNVGTIFDQLHQTLIDNPGFYGIAQTIDEAEQFTGFVNVSTGLTDVVGIIRSVGLTITDNTPPVLIRGSLLVFGFILLIALIIKAAQGPVEAIAPVAEAFT